MCWKTSARHQTCHPMTAGRLTKLSQICSHSAVVTYGADFQPPVLDETEQSLVILIACV